MLAVSGCDSLQGSLVAMPGALVICFLGDIDPTEIYSVHLIYAWTVCGLKV